MAKETKTIQYYPDDGLINQANEVRESFGWEVLSNQRCQEETNNGTKTFNKVSYSREKTSSWYREVCALEQEFWALNDEVEACVKPELRWGNKFNLLILTFFTFFAWPVLKITIYLIKMYLWKKQRPEIESRNYPRMEELLNKAEALVNGN